MGFFSLFSFQTFFLISFQFSLLNTIRQALIVRGRMRPCTCKGLCRQTGRCQRGFASLLCRCEESHYPSLKKSGVPPPPPLTGLWSHPSGTPLNCEFHALPLTLLSRGLCVRLLFVFSDHGVLLDMAGLLHLAATWPVTKLQVQYLTGRLPRSLRLTTR